LFVCSLNRSIIIIIVVIIIGVVVVVLIKLLLCNIFIKVSNAPKKSEESKNNNGCFFYPNGTKSISMRTTIQDSMRKINEESLNPPKRKPKKSINQYGKKLEKSYSNTLEKEIQLKRTNHLRKHTQVYTNSLRTSLIDRPLTAASTSSIMKLKGKSIDSYGNDGSFSMSQSSNNSDQLSTTSSSSSSSPSSSSNSMSRQRPSTTDATMERNRHGNGNGTFRGRIGSKESNLSRPSSSFSVMSNNDESNSQVHNRGDSGNGDIKKLNIADMKRRLKSSSGRLEMGLMQQHPTSYYY